MKWFVYIVKCSDDSLYTGISTDINRRINEHNQKLGAKSLRGKLPVKLIYFEKHKDQIKAAKRER
ncbi:MAG: GIY-YIG nuclease family protein, partial [bacterium]|nr:GIY-YIG nuclease family protein [bacterium]